MTEPCSWMERAIGLGSSRMGTAFGGTAVNALDRSVVDVGGVLFSSTGGSGMVVICKMIP